MVYARWQMRPHLRRLGIETVRFKNRCSISILLSVLIGILSFDIDTV